MQKMIRASILGAAFVTLTGQALPTAADAGANFCTRLGQNIGLDESKLADRKAGWTANALNFGQRFLVGGTAATSVAAEPVEPVTVEEYKRADAMCVAEGKGAVCRLVGPVNFRFGWKGNTTVTPVMPHERAVVRVEGIKTICQPDEDKAKA